MKKTIIFSMSILFILLLCAAEPSLAGPGGKIATAVATTFWGKFFLGLLIILFLPLIFYVIIREKLAERRARKDLRFMASYSATFEWLKIMERAKDCFYRVHSSWEQEDLSAVTSWMTDWYWQNQQIVHLNRWQREGLVNICQVEKITNIKPLLFVHRNRGDDHEDSMVVLSINAKMKDYLQNKASNEIVEGDKSVKEVETIWSFTLEKGAWKVSEIEEGSMSLAYAKMVRELPPIETTLSPAIKEGA